MRQVPGNLLTEKGLSVFLSIPYLQVFHLQTEKIPILISFVYFKVEKFPLLDPRGWTGRGLVFLQWSSSASLIPWPSFSHKCQWTPKTGSECVAGGKKDGRTASFDGSWGLEHHTHKWHPELNHPAPLQLRPTSRFRNCSEEEITPAQPFVGYSFPKVLQLGVLVVWCNFTQILEFLSPLQKMRT